MLAGDDFGVGDNRSASHRTIRTPNIRDCDDRSVYSMRETKVMLLARSRTRNRALIMLQETSLTPATPGDARQPAIAIAIAQNGRFRLSDWSAALCICLAFRHALAVAGTVSPYG